MQLPAGPLDTVIGAEHEKSRLQRGMDAERQATALFAELRAPVISGSNDRGARREVLALLGAARRDDYSDFGSETTWHAGVEFRPFEPVLLRGTHGTAFKPPTLFNLAAPNFSGSGGIPVVDPLRGETVVVQTISGGNPNLEPTTAESSTLGVVWSPREVRALNLSMTWWTLRIDNAINLPNAQFIINNEGLYPGRVVRAPAPPGQLGPIVSVDRTYINFGSMREEGIDAAADWTIGTAYGVFTPSLAATYMTKFEGASTPGAASVDRLSKANSDGIFAPRLKAIASIGWSPSAAFRVSLTGRYIGRYDDYTPPRTLGDFWYLDGAVEMSLGKMAKLLVTGTNLTDYDPPYSTHFRGYDIYNYDIVGRTIFVRLQMRT
jgi:iron complex outermembrane receptor protein